MLLPPRPDGSRLSLPDGTRQVLIIGANGSGKTRFTDCLVRDLGDRAVKLAVLDALYAAPDSERGLDKVMGRLLRDEVATLFDYKVRRRGDREVPLPATKLDTVIDLWTELFPGNDILVEEGRLLFSSTGAGDNRRGSLGLSTGEKTVLYYITSALYAPPESVVVVDNPGLFLHPSVTGRVWDRIETVRSDCRFVYTTHDLDFASSRSAAATVWVREYHAAAATWDYDILPPDTDLGEELYMTILGARRPVMFIEGDEKRSIDAKLYPLIFPDYTVKALGSCDRVIESTRVFNSLQGFHHLDSYGIVDRDRRSEQEVDYLRRKRVLVPEVAEVENLLMLSPVVDAVAAARGRDGQRVVAKVKGAVMAMFKRDYRKQALMHTRHRVKRTVEHRIDGRFTSINGLEDHLSDLLAEVNPRATYEQLCREFSEYIKTGDYAAVLRVYNQKSMLTETNVASLAGCRDKNDYMATVFALLKRRGSAGGDRIRAAIRAAFLL